MTDNPDRYYRSAGAVPFTGILSMLVCGFVAAAICGGVYAAADWYIAYDIVPFFCAPLAGAGIGAAVKGGAMLGRARHRGFLALVGLAMGAVGWYFSWVFFLRIFDGVGVWIWEPNALLAIINFISEMGVWDNQPTGFWLKMIYVVEALALMVPATIVASLEMRPFCDPCNAWTKAVPAMPNLKLTDPDALRERLENSEYEALDELSDPAVNLANCFQAKVVTCPRCEESNYLTVSQVTIVQKGNETHRNEEAFITNLWVPAEVVDQVQELAARPTGTGEVDDMAAAFGAQPAEPADEERPPAERQ